MAVTQNLLQAQLGPTGCSKGFCAHPLEINLSLSF